MYNTTYYLCQEKVHGSRDGAYALQVTWTSIHEGQFGWVDINTKLQTWHHFPRKPASHLVAGWLNWTIFITEETALVLTGGGESFTCMVLPFTFLFFEISDKNHYHSIIYNITCDKETHIISNIGFMPMDLTELSCSPHAETAGLVKLWNGLWKALLWFQLVRASLGLE